MKISEKQVTDWVNAYLKAWKSTDPKDIAAVFAEDGESHEWPYETAWIGLDAIVRGWQAREDWQKGGWTFEWELLAINGCRLAGVPSGPGAQELPEGTRSCHGPSLMRSGCAPLAAGWQARDP